MSAANRAELIDFHSHYYDPAWMPEATPRGFSAAMARSRMLLTDIDAQLAAMADVGVDAKVLSAPLSTLVGPGEQPPVALTREINDRYAALVAAYPDRLFALASIDAFGGDHAAREVERAIQSLHLHGICLDCARGDRFLSAPEARPVLETAARLRVPVFIHPVSPAGYSERLARLGQVGNLMARGTEDAASILALLHSGTLTDLPDLKIVIPLMAASILLFSGMLDTEGGRAPTIPQPSEVLTGLYVDTMGFNASTVRFIIDMVGVDHVVVGSDWPIMPIAARQRVDAMLANIAITDDERAAICGGNARRLLGAA